jgi:hypothetical protein
LQQLQLLKASQSTQPGVQHSVATAQQSVLQQPALSMLSNASQQRVQTPGQFRRASPVLNTWLLEAVVPAAPHLRTHLLVAAAAAKLSLAQYQAELHRPTP